MLSGSSELCNIWLYSRRGWGIWIEESNLREILSWEKVSSREGKREEGCEKQKERDEPRSNSFGYSQMENGLADHTLPIESFQM